MLINNPQFPIYLPSKGRHNIKGYTSDNLTIMQIPHYIVVEESQYDAYNENYKNNQYVTLLILDKKYQDEYETLDDLGYTKSKGPGAARNFAWDHSIKMGFDWHWVMDDNIMSFKIFNNNRQITTNSGAMFKAMEDFCLRYKNVVMAGPSYYMFVPRKKLVPPYIKNSRIYSCNLIRNDIPFRWRGRYNEDTILSLDILTAGLCTVQFNAFLQEKLTTQVLGGGNTEDFYAKEGTMNKSKMLEDTYPKLAKVVWKFSRWHHHVDYTPFKKNMLIFKDNYIIKKGINNYGMVLEQIK
jgi:hypothetical protein